MSTNEEIIGRAEIDDLEAILAISAADVDEAIRTVQDHADAIFTWDYEKGRRPALEKLYEKSKVSMWNGETDLPWDTVVDQEQVARDNQALNGGMEAIDLAGTPFEKWDEKQWLQLGVEFQNWSLSQFMHGEQ
ncbi:MAG: ferritin-like domain-containing protein, partial [Acidimicrobiales bacterium]|nr:ferritin-like domain-containing protein [Acidimicrobiales bacterium]